MEPAERAQAYAALAESTRRLVGLMDGKAGFLFAVNGALLTFMWIGARLGDVAPAAQWLALGASLGSLLALLAALWVVIPRRSIALPGSESERPPSDQLLRVRRRPSTRRPSFAASSTTSRNSTPTIFRARRSPSTSWSAGS